MTAITPVPAFGEWAVYECDRLTLGQTPQNEREIISGFSTPLAAHEWASAMKRSNRAKSYVVGLRA